MRFGDINVETIETGTFGLDGGAMFGVVPRPLWERNHAPDARNRIRLALRTLLIRAGARTILVDTGIGDKLDAKHREMYAVEQPAGGQRGQLERRGVAPGSVTDIVLTHLHFDHSGGATVLDGGVLAPAYPNARVHVQRANWDWACTPNDRERASYLKENFQPIADAGLLELHDGPFTLCDGVSVMVSDGHTRGQQLVRVDGGGRTLVFPGDLVPTASHLRTAWIMSYDIEPLKIMEEKKRLLGQAAREGWIVCFEHDAARPACTIAEHPSGWQAAADVELGAPR